MFAVYKTVKITIDVYLNVKFIEAQILANFNDFGIYNTQIKPAYDLLAHTLTLSISNANISTCVDNAQEQQRQQQQQYPMGADN